MIPPILSLLIAIFLIIAVIIWFRFDNDKDYENWFTELKNQAKFYGYASHEIEGFDMVDFEDYWLAGHSPEEALKLKLSEQ